jgi:hypothetical protein
MRGQFIPITNPDKFKQVDEVYPELCRVAVTAKTLIGWSGVREQLRGLSKYWWAQWHESQDLLLVVNDAHPYQEISESRPFIPRSFWKQTSLSNLLPALSTLNTIYYQHNLRSEHTQQTAQNTMCFTPPCISQCLLLLSTTNYLRPAYNSECTRSRIKYGQPSSKRHFPATSPLHTVSTRYCQAHSKHKVSHQ